MNRKEILSLLEEKGLLPAEEDFTLISAAEMNHVGLALPHLLIIRDAGQEEVRYFCRRCLIPFQRGTEISFLQNSHLLSMGIEAFEGYPVQGKGVILFDSRKAQKREAMPFAVSELKETMDSLLSPSGCPWDKAQDHLSLRTYFFQEAAEVIDAIDKGDMDNLKEELGDVLFQIVFHAALAEREGYFTMADVEKGVSDKMVKRHPLVFNKNENYEDFSAPDAWEKRKRIEKNRHYLLSGVPKCLPSLLLACIIQKKVSSNGLQSFFLSEDMGENGISDFKEMVSFLLKSDRVVDRERKAGQLLFILARVLQEEGIDPEQALRRYAIGFMDRLQLSERSLEKNGRNLEDLASQEAMQLWERYLSTLD